MLMNTFCHLPRVGKPTEIKLWKQGIKTWKDFVQTQDVYGIGNAVKPRLDRELKQCQNALFNGDSSFFCCLPSNEQWRLWSEFSDEACFIDIETNYQNNITVLGISDGIQVWQFVRGQNMYGPEIKKLLSQFKVMVTFNGASFDLPIIKRYFSDVVPEIPHIDLRHAGAKVGLRGGLKSIEKEIGIDRGEELDGVTGSDALKLWHAYRATGEKKFMQILLDYNAEDILNLKPLAELVYGRLIVDYGKHFN